MLQQKVEVMLRVQDVMLRAMEREGIEEEEEGADFVGEPQHLKINLKFKLNLLFTRKTIMSKWPILEI
jgi:hypothetical protein